MTSAMGCNFSSDEPYFQKQIENCKPFQSKSSSSHTKAPSSHLPFNVYLTACSSPARPCILFDVSHHTFSHLLLTCTDTAQSLVKSGTAFSLLGRQRSYFAVAFEHLSQLSYDDCCRYSSRSRHAPSTITFGLERRTCTTVHVSIAHSLASSRGGATDMWCAAVPTILH